jgi:hypothetical protein
MHPDRPGASDSHGTPPSFLEWLLFASSFFAGKVAVCFVCEKILVYFICSFLIIKLALDTGYK